MSDERPNKVGMKPPHPGDFIRTEILDELHLSLARAAEILGVRRTTLSDLIHGKASLSVDFTFWYQRSELFNHEEEPVLVFGEAKSFAVGSFQAKDITRMRKLAEKFPSAFLVFATLKDALTEHEQAEIATLALWGRELLDDGRPRAPVIVLTGTELFSEEHVKQTWEALNDQRGQLAASPALRLDNLWTFADLTQQSYPSLPDRYAALIEQLTAPHPNASEGGQPPP